MKRVLALCLTLVVAAQAQAINQLTNGDFESGAGSVYYDGFDPSVSDDEPGWELFLGSADGSYVLISPEATPTPESGARDLDMGNGPAGGGVRTSVGSRPSVTPTLSYIATVTTDNYFAPTSAAYFIDWFDGGGALLSSAGGLLADPNGAAVYAPYTQLFSVVAVAPAGAASAGVRFEAGNGGYAGLAADNFTFDVVPEPSSLVLLATGLYAFRLRRSK